MHDCSIRQITAEVGAAVLRAAIAEELAEGHGDVGPRELEHMTEVCPFTFVHNKAYCKPEKRQKYILFFYFANLK